MSRNQWMMTRRAFSMLFTTNRTTAGASFENASPMTRWMMNTVEFSFLRYRGDDMWDFPKQLDIEMVEIKYVFYGPCSPEVVTGKGYQISFGDIANAQFRYKYMKAHNIYAKL